jgi:hypothetical protein
MFYNFNDFCIDLRFLLLLLLFSLTFENIKELSLFKWSIIDRKKQIFEFEKHNKKELKFSSNLPY